MFVATKVCDTKYAFVATKIIHVELPANDSFVPVRPTVNRAVTSHADSPAVGEGWLVVSSSADTEPLQTHSRGAVCRQACQRSIGVNETSQNIGIQDSAEFITLATGELTLQYTFADPSGVNG